MILYLNTQILITKDSRRLFIVKFFPFHYIKLLLMDEDELSSPFL